MATHGNLSSRKITFCGANGVGSSSDATVKSIVSESLSIFEKQMCAATRRKGTNPILVQESARFALCHDKIFAWHRSPLHMGCACASPAIYAMTIDQRTWLALQHVPCPTTNASTSDCHTIHLPEQMNYETKNSAVVHAVPKPFQECWIAYARRIFAYSRPISIGIGR